VRSGSRFVDLTPRERQAANRDWWTEHPMTYRAGLEPGTTEWFEDVDRRFLQSAFYAHRAGVPFGRFISPEMAAGRRVLEVGCGMGTHAALLIRAGAGYTGVDLTEPAVRMTRRRLELAGLRGDVQQADAERLPFGDASFNAVWSWGVIHHSASFDRCFSEMTRVLEPGGRIVLMVYHHPSLFYYLYCVLARGILRGERRHRSFEDIYLDQIDGAYARRFRRTELAGIFSSHYDSVQLDVAGQKEELFPLPRSHIKRRLVAATPDRLASAVLSRLGHLIVVQAVRAA
jgi:SAM-dependent methyltransferase